MDSLAKAKSMIQDSDVQEPSYANVTIEQAKVYAAIAQVEQLKRIAVSLEAVGHALEAIAAGPAETSESHAAMRRVTDAA